MKIIYAGVISTGSVIILGIALVMPIFFSPTQLLPVILSFDVVDQTNLPQWCNELSSVLKKYDIKSVVFVSGKVAQQHPQCVTDFSNKIDIGSETYDYVPLTSIQDYSQQLEEIKKGKLAVDITGNLDSKLFRAPYLTVDGNIYSLLTRSGILADFSYKQQYNKYYDNKFLKFDLFSYDGTETSPTFIQGLSKNNGPVFIYFDNTTPTEKIDDFISKLKSSNVKFLNASDLTGLDLTVRRGWFT